MGWNAVPDSAEKDVIDVFRSGQYSPGKKCREFEEAWAKAHQAKHAIFVNSGTDALRLSLMAMKEKYGWRDGDEVAVPALTFVATVNVIEQARLNPFFVDVGMYDYLMNEHNLDRHLRGTRQTNVKAVMPVHLFGGRCSDGIYEVARKYKLRVLEDSCETIGNAPRGDVSCHSTYMAHHVTTGVGGFAVTNDGELNELIRSYANHGRNPDYLPGYKKSTDIKKRFQFDRVGYSCRGTEFEAVLGLSQMDGIQENIGQRRRVAKALGTVLRPYVKCPTGDEEGHTFMMFPVVLNDDPGIDKYDLCLQLEKNGIETRDMMPITSQPCYRKYFDNDLEEYTFSVAKNINKNGFYIPIHPGMTGDDVGWVAEVFRKALSRKLQRV